MVQDRWGIPVPWLVGMRWWELLTLHLGCPTAAAGPGALVSSPARAAIQMSKEHDVCPGGFSLDSLGGKHGGSPALSHWRGDTQ